MRFPIQLLPGSDDFFILRERLVCQAPICHVLSLSESVCPVAQYFLPHSLFTEQWRNYQQWIRVGFDSQSPSLPSEQEQIRALNELSQSRKNPLCNRVLKKTLRPLFTNDGGRDRRVLIPRSNAVFLGSPLARYQKATTPSDGTLWLKRARTCLQPCDTKENFFHQLLISLGLLVAHPFCDGNGRLSRALLNVAASAPTGKAFPWSICFLLRNGNYLYNVLPNFRGNQLSECILLSVKNAVSDAERKLDQLWKRQQNAPSSLNNPTEIREQLRWKETFLFS